MRKLLRMLALPLLLFASLQSLAQVRTITGTVTDASGLPLGGVSVTVKGETAGTITSETGAYSLSVNAAATTLVFSSVGYTPVEETIGDRTTINVSLTSTAANLSEVVVIGYGTARKKDLTGSVTAVTARDFNKGAITTPEQLISGKVAGVQIVSNGGAPGAGSTIRIRGGASLNASNDPLIVIDGVPISNDGIAGTANALALINPNDIESFNILKDASATAIYGSRASNGVIIITTKKGSRGAPRWNFSTQNSIATLPKKADVLTGAEFREFVQAHGTPSQVALLGTANTDWQDEIYDNAFTTDNNLSVSGSMGGKLPYRLSLGYLNQDGILITGNMHRTSASLNLSPTIWDNHLKIDLNLKGSLSGSRFADEGAIGNAVRFDPTKPVMSGDSKYGGYWEWLDPNSASGLKELAPLNPVGLLEQRDDKSDVKRSIGNLQLDYRTHFLPDLRLNLNLGYDISQGEGTVYIPNTAASSYLRSPDAKHGGVDNRYLQKKFNKLLEAYLNYNKDITSIKSRIDFTAGYSFQNFLTDIRNAEEDANGVLYQQPDGSLDTAYVANATRWTPFSDWTTDRVLLSWASYPFDKPENTLISLFGRLNYTLMNRYLFTATLRRDGSSRFAGDNRWGLFPSAAFAWRISEEDFLRNSNAVSDLKLRLGYGVTGQQEGIGLYDYLPRYSQSNAQAAYQLGDNFYRMYRPAGYNPNLKWEQTTTYNAGLDYGFAGGRISGTIDVYLKQTDDLLSVIDQPAGTNFSNKVIANIGSMENRGIEFTINTQPVRNSTMNWDLGFNVTYNKNEITKLTQINDPDFPGNLVGGIAGGVGSSIQIHSVGYPKSSFYVYQQVYDKEGKPIEGVFEDRNRDGIINIDDLYRFHSPDPKVFLGAYSNFNWNNWDASFTLRANLDNYVYNNRFSNTGTQRNLIDPLGYLANGSRNVLETGFSGAGDQYLLSDYYIENASFLRMDNISVGYNAGSLLSKNSTLRIGATVQNVFTITNYKGVDPEVFGGIDMNFYPRPRNFVLSANLSF
ncbi:MAG: SusC/RagA family TonB-linked outer membrane protein [Flavisolibacter sp.]